MPKWLVQLLSIAIAVVRCVFVNAGFSRRANIYKWYYTRPLVSTLKGKDTLAKSLYQGLTFILREYIIEYNSASARSRIEQIEKTLRIVI